MLLACLRCHAAIAPADVPRVPPPQKHTHRLPAIAFIRALRDGLDPAESVRRAFNGDEPLDPRFDCDPSRKRPYARVDSLRTEWEDEMTLNWCHITETGRINVPPSAQTIVDALKLLSDQVGPHSTLYPVPCTLYPIPWALTASLSTLHFIFHPTPLPPTSPLTPHLAPQLNPAPPPHPPISPPT